MDSVPFKTGQKTLICKKRILNMNTGFPQNLLGCDPNKSQTADVQNSCPRPKFG